MQPLVLVLLVLAAPALAEKLPIQVLPLPSESGSLVEVRVTLDVSAERVARVTGDPSAFRELFPAEQAKIIGAQGAADLVQVAMRHPWPVGLVHWIETVARRREGESYIVERNALRGFFRRMSAIWRITPLGPERSAVSYRVFTEPDRWAPTWVLRRGNISGMVATMERLKNMLQSGR